MGLTELMPGSTVPIYVIDDQCLQKRIEDDVKLTRIYGTLSQGKRIFNEQKFKMLPGTKCKHLWEMKPTDHDRYLTVLHAGGWVIFHYKNKKSNKYNTTELQEICQKAKRLKIA